MAGRKERVIIMTGKPFNQKTLKKEIPPVYSQLNKPFHINKFLEAVSSALAPHQKKKRAAIGSPRKGRIINAL